MSTLSRVVVLAVASFAIATQACTLASPTTVKYEPAADDKSTSDATEGAKSTTPAAGGTATAPACSAKFTKPDVAKLDACGSGKGHCYAKEKMSAPMQSLFAADTCKTAGDVCVSDEFLNANGGKLASCTSSAAGGAGACVHKELIAPLMADKRSSALGQDDCAAAMTCVPCVNPLDKTETGFCNPTGVNDAACSGGAATTTAPAPAKELPACCTTNGKSNGVCMPTDGVPASARDSVVQDSCADANSCVPKSMVEGAAVKCDGGILGAGVCMDKCFNDMMSIGGTLHVLSSDGCGETELCIPCKLAKMKSGSTPIPGCE